jgi:hypothetical protein
MPKLATPLSSVAAPAFSRMTAAIPAAPSPEEDGSPGHGSPPAGVEQDPPRRVLGAIIFL